MVGGPQSQGDASLAAPATSRGEGRGTAAARETDARFAIRWLGRTSQPFAQLSFDGRFLFVNAAFERLTGYTAAELLSMTLRDLTPESWRAAGEAVLARV